jgi:SAM-dependent methyltransferase
LERHRILWLFLQRETDILTQPRSILHLAPEGVLSSLLQRPNIEYVSGDLEPGRAMEVMDITALPCPDHTFDTVICNHVLEHVPGDVAAMREIRRVLRPGGVAIMQHPIDSSLAKTYEEPTIVTPEARLQAYGQEDHVRLYGRDFPDRLVAAGFQITVRRYLDELDPSERSWYGLSDGRKTGLNGADIYECLAAKEVESANASRLS